MGVLQAAQSHALAGSFCGLESVQVTICLLPRVILGHTWFEGRGGIRAALDADPEGPCFTSPLKE